MDLTTLPWSAFSETIVSIVLANHQGRAHLESGIATDRGDSRLANGLIQPCALIRLDNHGL